MPKRAVQESEIIFICVNTPTNEHQEADLTAVKEVAKAIGQHMDEYKIVVNKSTVPVGTADLVEKIIKKTSKKRLNLMLFQTLNF